MSTPNPLVPEGSLQQPKGKSNIKIAVFTILAIHAVLLVGLLMQGCKEKPQPTPEETAAVATNDFASIPSLPADPALTSAPTVAPSAIPTPSAVPAVGTSSPVAAVAPTVPATVTPVAPLTPSADVAPTASAKEYAIAAGDTLGKIAKENHVTLKALVDANPSVNPNRLKIGQKIQIPEATASAAPTSSDIATTGATTGSEDVYVVKSGDMLERIAKTHGTTVKAIKSANNLKTDRLKVGQKLKLPAGKTATASVETVPVATTSALTPTPLTTTATMAAK